MLGEAMVGSFTNVYARSQIQKKMHLKRQGSVDWIGTEVMPP